MALYLFSFQLVCIRRLLPILARQNSLFFYLFKLKIGNERRWRETKKKKTNETDSDRFTESMQFIHMSKQKCTHNQYHLYVSTYDIFYACAHFVTILFYYLIRVVFRRVQHWDWDSPNHSVPRAATYPYGDHSQIVCACARASMDRNRSQ